MHKINLQQKTKAQKGTAEMYWFENEFTGLKNTLFHRITIPLTAFNSGLEYGNPHVETEICIERLDLQLENLSDLDGLIITSEKYSKMEVTVYIGDAHNWCNVKKIIIKRKEDNRYSIEGELFVEFENEGVAQNEPFEFTTTIEFKKI